MHKMSCRPFQPALRQTVPNVAPILPHPPPCHQARKTPSPFPPLFPPFSRRLSFAGRPLCRPPSHFHPTSSQESHRSGRVGSPHSPRSAPFCLPYLVAGASAPLTAPPPPSPKIHPSRQLFRLPSRLRVLPAAVPSAAPSRHPRTKNAAPPGAAFPFFFRLNQTVFTTAGSASARKRNSPSTGTSRRSARPPCPDTPRPSSAPSAAASGTLD